MESVKRIGRVVGVLLVLHLAVGLMVPFILLDQVRGSAGLLANAAGSPLQFRSAVLLLFVGSAMAVIVSVVGARAWRRHSDSMALALLGLAVTGFSLQVVDNAALMTILALSQEHASAAATQGDVHQTLAAVLGAGRRFVHYSYLFVAVSWILLLSTTLLRFRLVPPVLAGLGAAASLLQIAGVSVQGLLGSPPIMAMAMPLGPIYLGLALWLMIKGFADPSGKPTA
jgi:hypothetical protein